MKAFLIDLDKCTGCYACQIGCKDEHCGNTWMPYAEEQPEVGQFWMKVKQYDRGAVPHVRVAYTPTLCNHCEDAPCIKASKDGAVYRRDDGLIIVDPEKAKGQKAIVEACPYHAIYWNEALSLPQKCTGCAHLLDGEEPIKTPRCVDNCTTEAIQFGEIDELDLEGAEVMSPEYGTKPRVYYKNLPKKFIAGTVYDPAAKEVIIGAKVTATNIEYGDYTVETDDWGDFWLKQLPDADWKLTIEKDGKHVELGVSTKEKDLGLGDIALA